MFAKVSAMSRAYLPNVTGRVRGSIPHDIWRVAVNFYEWSSFSRAFCLVCKALIIKLRNYGFHGSFVILKVRFTKSVHSTEMFMPEYFTWNTRIEERVSNIAFIQRDVELLDLILHFQFQPVVKSKVKILTCVQGKWFYFATLIDVLWKCGVNVLGKSIISRFRY